MVLGMQSIRDPLNGHGMEIKGLGTGPGSFVRSAAQVSRVRIPSLNRKAMKADVKKRVLKRENSAMAAKIMIYGKRERKKRKKDGRESIVDGRLKQLKHV